MRGTRSAAEVVTIKMLNWTHELGALVLHGHKKSDVRPTSQLAGSEGELLGVRLGRRNSWQGAALSAEFQAEIARRRGAGTLVDASFIGKVAGTVRVGRTLPATEAARQAGGWARLCAAAGFASGGIKANCFVTELFEPVWLSQGVAATSPDFRCVTPISIARSALCTQGSCKRRAMGLGPARCASGAPAPEGAAAGAAQEVGPEVAAVQPEVRRVEAEAPGGPAFGPAAAEAAALQAAVRAEMAETRLTQAEELREVERRGLRRMALARRDLELIDRKRQALAPQVAEAAERVEAARRRAEEEASKAAAMEAAMEATMGPAGAAAASNDGAFQVDAVVEAAVLELAASGAPELERLAEAATAWLEQQAAAGGGGHAAGAAACGGDGCAAAA